MKIPLQPIALERVLSRPIQGLSTCGTQPRNPYGSHTSRLFVLTRTDEQAAEVRRLMHVCSSSLHCLQAPLARVTLVATSHVNSTSSRRVPCCGMLIAYDCITVHYAAVQSQGDGWVHSTADILSIGTQMSLHLHFIDTPSLEVKDGSQDLLAFLCSE